MREYVEKVKFWEIKTIPKLLKINSFNNGKICLIDENPRKN